MESTLQKIRGGTCYSALRSVTAVYFGALGACAIIGGVIWTFALLMTSFWYGLCAAVASLLAVFLIYAAYQASLLVVDIADAVISIKASLGNANLTPGSFHADQPQH